MPLTKNLTQVALVLLALTVQISPTASAAQQPATRPELIWSKTQTEIDSPSFSADGKEILMTVKAHQPDGAEAESYSEKQLKAIDDRKLSNPRWADPEVSILDLSTHSIQKVGYGWTGVFSKQGDKVYYDHQVKPISGLRRLSKPQFGNDIQVFDRKTGKSEVLIAAPEVGYLADPQLAPDGHRLAYTFNDNTNGDWGGGIGIGEYDLSDNKNSTILAPAKSHDLYHLVPTVFWAGNTLVYKVRVPLDKDVWLAKHYDVKLVNESGKELYKTPKPEGPFSDLQSGPTHNGMVQIHTPQEKATINIDPVTGAPVTGEKDIDPNQIVGPDGRFSASSDNHHLTVKDLQSNQKKTFPFKGEMTVMIWSPDSKTLAYITDVGTTPDPDSPFVRDELWTLKIAQ
jgi:hypothetical protein